MPFETCFLPYSFECSDSVSSQSSSWSNWRLDFKCLTLFTLKLSNVFWFGISWCHYLSWNLVVPYWKFSRGWFDARFYQICLPGGMINKSIMYFFLYRVVPFSFYFLGSLCPAIVLDITNNVVKLNRFVASAWQNTRTMMSWESCHVLIFSTRSVWISGWRSMHLVPFARARLVRAFWALSPRSVALSNVVIVGWAMKWPTLCFRHRMYDPSWLQVRRCKNLVSKWMDDCQVQAFLFLTVFLRWWGAW